ncbi:unspecified product [Leishmania tarentolae]|uniref:Unspecified product n=1 Tax=Leishmania tarentolae TaxID=5689 RepID=A0A640KAG9_LEITA|nr:unspecified product [Leishmania tarentolae]
MPAGIHSRHTHASPMMLRAHVCWLFRVSPMQHYRGYGRRHQQQCIALTSPTSQAPDLVLTRWGLRGLLPHSV